MGWVKLLAVVAGLDEVEDARSRQPIQEQGIRLTEAEPDGMIVHSGERGELFGQHEVLRLDRRVVVVEDQIIPPELEIVGARHGAVAPPQSFAQVEREGTIAVRYLVVMEDVGNDRLEVRGIADFVLLYDVPPERP